MDYIKSEYKQGVEIVKNVLDTLIWLRLDKTFFKLSEDIFICGAYVWGADSPDLQNSLNMLSEYCKRWGLEVNTAKTKVIVF